MVVPPSLAAFSVFERLALEHARALDERRRELGFERLSGSVALDALDDGRQVMAEISVGPRLCDIRTLRQVLRLDVEDLQRDDLFIVAGDEPVLLARYGGDGPLTAAAGPCSGPGREDTLSDPALGGEGGAT